MSLQLQSRQLGETLLIHCNGRIVAGDAVQALQTEVKRLMLRPFHLVLHLGDVTFVDSSGLGMLVRLANSARSTRKNLCLCCVPELVKKTLALTQTSSLFDTFETEEDAVRAVHRLAQHSDEKPECSRPPVLCLEGSADLRAYLGELLRRAGYWPLASGNLRDAVVLQRAVRAKTIVVGQEMLTPQGQATLQLLLQIVPGANVIELEPGFSQQDAGRAAERLLARLQTRDSERSND